MLAAITLTARGDGVASVAGLLRDALSQRDSHGCHVVTMFDGPARKPALRDKVAFLARLSGEVLLRRPAWILFSHLGLARAQRLVPPGLRPPYAVFLHGIEAWEPLAPPDRALLRRATLRLANSSYTAQRVMRANPDIGPVVACPLAIADTARHSNRAVTSLPDVFNDGAQVVLIVGALRSDEKYKGHDELIAAWPEVTAAVPNAHLVIVGDGDDRTRLESVADASPARRSITFLGYASSDMLAECYAHADLFAMPSRGEGFGLVYLEAMAHKLPCIGSRDDAAGDVIRDGVTGLLVDQRNAAALAAAIVSLLQNPERRLAMGEAGRTRVETEFSMSAFRSRLDRAIESAFPTASLPEMHRQ